MGERAGFTRTQIVFNQGKQFIHKTKIVFFFLTSFRFIEIKRRGFTVRRGIAIFYTYDSYPVSDNFHIF